MYRIIELLIQENLTEKNNLTHLNSMKNPKISTTNPKKEKPYNIRKIPRENVMVKGIFCGENKKFCRRCRPRHNDRPIRSSN